MPGVDLEGRLRRHVDVLAELIGERNTQHPQELDAARNYIERELKSYGYEVKHQSYEIRVREAVNLQAKIPSKSNKPVLVVGAHYDTARGTPGADDNASAVAMLLEIARHLATAKSARREVQFVFYDCEEMPHFSTGEMGSQHHAHQLRQSNVDVLGMICLESVGYYTRHIPESPDLPWPLRMLMRWLGGNHIVIVSDLSSILFGLRFVFRFLFSGTFPFLPAALPRKISVIELSDHRGYWEQGYRALMVTDTAFLRNPNYHRSTDRLDTLDFPRMSRLCKQLSITVQAIAGIKLR